LPVGKCHQIALTRKSGILAEDKYGVFHPTTENKFIVMKKIVLTFFLIYAVNSIKAQVIEDSTSIINSKIDSLIINEVEGKPGKPKVFHAEPLYIDLIRDLGARKGEKEWNVGLGLTDNNNYDAYSGLIEYEFAPIDRLGLELELPFTFYYPTNGNVIAPASKMNSLKLAAQWSFLISEKYDATLALGYIHEFELTSFNQYGKESLYQGNIFNPFFIAAKRWGQNFHGLIYTGPVIESMNKEKYIHTIWQINSSFNYMISGTKNFFGIEINKDLSSDNIKMILRPQMRVSVADNLLVGIVTGIPVQKNNERLSSFVRVIYEPGHKYKRFH
jgi:hypothetical protein